MVNKGNGWCRGKDSLLGKIKCNPAFTSKYFFLFSSQIYDEKNTRIKKFEIAISDKQKKEEGGLFSIMIFDLVKNESRAIGAGVIATERRKERKNLFFVQRFEGKGNELQHVFQRHLEFEGKFAQ